MHNRIMIMFKHDINVDMHIEFRTSIYGISNTLKYVLKYIHSFIIIIIILVLIANFIEFQFHDVLAFPFESIRCTD